MKLSNLFYLLGFASIILSASNYLSNDDSDSERDGIFVGHWPPTLFILGKIVEDRENANKNILTGE